MDMYSQHLVHCRHDSLEAEGAASGLRVAGVALCATSLRIRCGASEFHAGASFRSVAQSGILSPEWLCTTRCSPLLTFKWHRRSTVPPVPLRQLSVSRFHQKIRGRGVGGGAQFLGGCQSRPVVLCCFFTVCRGSHLDPLDVIFQCPLRGLLRALFFFFFLKTWEVWKRKRTF